MAGDGGHIGAGADGRMADASGFSADPGAHGDFVVLYADGACSGNPGPGGWGAVLFYPRLGRTREFSGAEPGTTNNRMELTAVLRGLEALKRPCDVKVVTDSRYVADAFGKNWLDRWQKNGWRTADRQPVKNEDLWRPLLQEARRHRLSWEWIKGHTGHPGNEQADTLAVQARKKLL